ncbi:acyl-CoA dehydrogenase [Novosphingobium olei]|uniref:Acyl-CoA dehydrogenase n=1 Tax=Novosphingobium olei TaxID=2728851 RepID=A0A7Y0GAP1_9SPHN|nr:acyl-CoA dehydrogenase [Novosphingobium olei]NML94134.1 acyl-CoA dehydrogenase [Novosphingobium olei]BEV00644.1 acyl-CoA dehydrogenase [Novosphingobium olei]
MDFEDTPEEAAFRAEVRSWIDANAPKHLEDQLKRANFGDMGVTSEDPIQACKSWQKKKAEAGWACLHWPKEYGGGNRTPMERVIWNQEEGIFRSLGGLFTIGQGMCGPTVMAWADEETKRRMLPPLASGEEVWCQLFSEPASGSDLAGLRTRAVKADDGSGDWIVNGQKIWTSGAQNSDWGLLIARTDPDVPKHKGLTMFFLSMKSPGVEVRPIKQANGQSSFNEVYFTDVRIPDSQRLGAVGQGWEVSLTTLMNERLSIGSGMSTGFPQLLSLCMDVEVDGKPAVQDSNVRSKLAQFAVREMGLKYTGMRAITALSKGETPGPENSIGKLVAGATMQDLAMFALDLQGQSGVIWEKDGPHDGRFQAILMRSPATRIEGGSDEILRNIIGERVLGLPGDIRVDKDVAFKDIPTSGRKKAAAAA